MRFLVLTLLAVAIALGLGGWSADLMMRRFEGVDAVVVGPWHTDRTAGSPNADPYAKARLARSGNLTLGLGEGVAFQAHTDMDGRELRRECSYRLEGAYPPARVWTLSAFTPAGRSIPAADGRPDHLVSSTLLRGDDNSVLVSVGPLARSGNWMATEGTGPMVLALTFYDSPISTDSGAAPLAMPFVRRTGCSADG